MSASAAPADTTDRADRLYGLPTIARFVGLTIDEAHKLTADGTLPTTVRVGNIICARKSELRIWPAGRGGA